MQIDDDTVGFSNWAFQPVDQVSSLIAGFTMQELAWIAESAEKEK